MYRGVSRISSGNGNRPQYLTNLLAIPVELSYILGQRQLVPVFKKCRSRSGSGPRLVSRIGSAPRLVGWIGSGIRINQIIPRLVGRLGSGIRVDASFRKNARLG